MARRQAGLLICVAVLVAPAVVRADVVFTNLGPGGTYNAFSGNPVGFGPSSITTYGEGETFTPSQNYNLTAIQLALSIGGSDAGSSGTNEFPIYVSLASDAGNQPGASLQTITIPAHSLGPIFLNNPVIVLSASPLLLTAGTQYWVTVTAAQAEPAAVSDVVEWNLNNTGDSADNALSTDGGATWTSPSGQTPGAFEVDGDSLHAVPEPGSWTIWFTAGALGLVAVRSRRGGWTTNRTRPPRRSRH